MLCGGWRRTGRRPLPRKPRRAALLRHWLPRSANVLLVLLRHKLRRERPFILRRERRFDLAPQHGQRDRISTSLATSRRRMVAMEFGTCRSGRSGGSSGSVTLGKGKLREENFGNRS